MIGGGKEGDSGNCSEFWIAENSVKFALDLGAGDLVSYSRLLRGGLKRVADLWARFPAREGR